MTSNEADWYRKFLERDPALVGDDECLDILETTTWYCWALWRRLDQRQLDRLRQIVVYLPADDVGTFGHGAQQLLYETLVDDREWPFEALLVMLEQSLLLVVPQPGEFNELIEARRADRPLPDFAWDHRPESPAPGI